jgi:hypothetical protein
LRERLLPHSRLASFRRTSFSYNPANQITLRTRSNTAYIYGGDVNVARTYAVNGLNQYVAAVSNGVTTGFQHDRNGNLVSDGAVSFVYDAENRLMPPASGAFNSPARHGSPNSGFTTTRPAYILPR